MTNTTAAVPVSRPARPSFFKAFSWLLFLTIAGMGWYLLLCAMAPARVEFTGGGAAIAMSFTPPFLLTLLCWIGVRSYASPPAVVVAPAASDVPTMPAQDALPTAKFRVGAWSVLTPHGNAAKTVVSTKARKAAFKPDKAILLANGNPAHVSMVGNLRLDSVGYPVGTRLRLPRLAAMLTAILDDLHSQQISLAATFTGPVNIYWLVPEPILNETGSHTNIFVAAWRRSAWRDEGYLLHIVPAEGAGAYTVLATLQDGINDSLIPYTVVIAADSLLDAKELAPALGLENIFSDSAPHGFIPSEAAAGFILFNPARSPEDMWLHAATLAPVTEALLEQGSSRKDREQTLCSTVGSSILAAAKSAVDVNVVVCDADHRIDGVIPVTNAMTQLLAHLDPLEQRLSPMEYLGSFGAATDLVHVAMAMEVASADSQVVCAICNSESQVASVLILPA